MRSLVACLCVLAACGGHPAPAPASRPATAGATSTAEPTVVAAVSDGEGIRAPLSRRPAGRITGAPALDPRRGPPERSPDLDTGEPRSSGFTFDEAPAEGYRFEREDGFTFDEDLPPLPHGLKRVEPVDGEVW